MDKDNPEWTEADFRRAKPAKEMMPELVEAMKRARGRPPVESPKVHIGMRLDADVVEWLRSQKGYNAMVNEALRQQMASDARDNL